MNNTKTDEMNKQIRLEFLLADDSSTFSNVQFFKTSFWLRFLYIMLLALLWVLQVLYDKSCFV